MLQHSFVLKGDCCDSLDRTHLRTVEDGYLVCVDGRCAGCFDTLPEKYRSLPLIDHSGKLIIPGLTDLHVHAPQYAFRALGMDQELLEWLEANVFPEESRYADLDYARAAYGKFVDDMVHSPNTRACVFATIHRPGAELLMELLENSGLVAQVGKVNMDRDCPDALREPSEASYAETCRWLRETRDRFANVTPIITPRFIPSCTDGLLEQLGELARQEQVPVQSHLSENPGEVELVAKLRPDCRFYGKAYDKHGLFGSAGPCIMAHCVYSGEEEIRLMQERGVYIAHCPQSNTNLASGIAPARRYLDAGMNMGLGSDVAGGASLSILRAMADAIQVSKLRWRLVDEGLKPLTVAEAFWLGTAGGGAYFGKVGRFLPDYEFDAVVLDDSHLTSPRPLTVAQRVERSIYLSENRDVIDKFVRGTQLKLN